MDTPHSLIRSATYGLQTAALAMALFFPLAHAPADDHGHEGEEHHHESEEESPAGLSAKAMGAFGVTLQTAGPGTVRVLLTLSGTLVPHEDRVAHVTPRYPGVIREVRKRLGDPVSKDEVVAVVEGNQSLQAYEVRSPLTGTVVKRHATAGEYAGEGDAIFEVADYGVLFADLFLFPSDAPKVRLGQKVVLSVAGESKKAETTLSFLSPVTDAATQSRFVRAALENPKGTLQPGMFATGDIVLEELEVPVAVDASAVRTSEGKPVVFVDEEGHLEPRPVIVGRKSKETVEIVSGITAGERYAAGNTFILQAELEKGEAGHGH